MHQACVLSIRSLQIFTFAPNRRFSTSFEHTLILLSYQIISKGRAISTGGTSASAPVWAGVVALLNDARLKAGMPVMGFINPWLYSVGYKGLTDIMDGAALGCNGVNLQTERNITGASIIPYASWNATMGWDPVTGHGVPDFGELLDLALGEECD